jgi:hypothetical protein
LSDSIINKIFVKRVKKSFNSIDLMTMMASKDLRVALKALQVSMCYHNVEEMIIDWDKDINVNDIKILIQYCINDVNSTSHLLSLLKNDISFRLFVQKKFGFSCLSKDGVGIGVEIFTMRICDKLGLSDSKQLYDYKDNYDIIRVSDFIAPIYNFKFQQFKKVYEFYNKMILDADGKKNGKSPAIKVIFDGLEYVFGIGGGHSKNLPEIHNPDPKFIYRDSDATSYYPSLSEQWGYGPKGFKTEFVLVIKDLKGDRVKAKSSGDKVTDKTYKLALNSILGHLRNEYSPYYAPEANLAICINGQLMLCMLVEECYSHGIKCIMLNTDGCTFKIPKDKEETYFKICTGWEKKTRIQLEHVDYEKMVILAVNDYFAFKEGYSKVKDSYTFPKPDECIEYNYTFVKNTPDGELMSTYEKQKGFFLTYPRLTKGLDSLIIPKALINYYGKGIPIEDTIQDFKSIYDYIIFQKVGKQFEVEWDSQKQQHINRYFVSKNAPYLYKKKEDGSLSNLLKGYGVILANKIDNPNEKEFFDIDYNYYIVRAREAIRKLEPEQLTLFN